jgi:hypothetical protein
LFSAATDIIVAHVIEFFLIFSFNRFSFCEEKGVGGNDAEFFRFTADYLEFYSLEVA